MRSLDMAILQTKDNKQVQPSKPRKSVPIPHFGRDYGSSMVRLRLAPHDITRYFTSFGGYIIK